MNWIHITLLIVFGFIIAITIILNFIKKDRIILIRDFIAKVLPTIPISKIFGRGEEVVLTKTREAKEIENSE